MAKGQADIFRHVQTLFGPGAIGGRTDAELLERFLARDGDVAEAAFEVLVRRHGPMVFRVCRDVLGDPHAAEDACQTAFLVFARKAAGIGRRERLGNWLHGVAHRTALKARAGAARRLRHERRAAGMAAESHAEVPGRHELAPLLHEEIGRLPERYRAPLVLCHLEQMSYAAAARHLGLTEATVRGRLARARDLLRGRLDRRGATPTAGLVAMAPCRGAEEMPASLVEATVRAAARIRGGGTAGAGAVPAAVAALTDQVMRGMFMSKLKTIGAGLLVLGGLASGAGWLAHHALAEPPRARPAAGPTAGEDNRAPGDRQAIQGTWTTEFSLIRSIDGVPQPPLKLEETWTIAPETLTTSLGERAVEVGLPPEMAFGYTLDPSRTPKEITLTSPALKALLGIYKLDGDELTICYGIERPAEFVDDEQGGMILRVFRRAGRSTEPAAPLFVNAPGCSWAVPPSKPGGLISMAGGLVLLSEEVEGALVVTLARPVVLGPGPSPEYRPIAFDAARNRHALVASLGGTGGDPKEGPMVSLQRYRLDPGGLPAGEVTHLAVELVPPEALRQESAQAMGRAEAAGVEVLPPPRVGSGYDFALTAMDGRVLRSQDLRGKVVLIDCWASWCSPCMAKMPKLRALYERHRADGFEVVGICFDQEAEKARRAIEAMGMTWPQVLVPADEDSRALWAEGPGIVGLPRLLVLDRRGVLRADGGPQEIEEQVARWLKESAGEE